MGECLELPGKRRRNALIAVDSMAVTLAKTQRHRCKKFNNRTVGGGVLWAFALDGARGGNPLRILKTMRGAWNDAHEMLGIRLMARGPIYLMDRGFFGFAWIQQMLCEQVHFILRMRKEAAKHVQVMGVISQPRRIGRKRLTLDAWVQLGGPDSKLHPCLRLVMVTCANGQDLYLLTDRQDLSAETILRMYKRRWEIESFHRLLKDALGFAHLYSFDQRGIEFLLRVAWLLAVMLYLSANDASGRTLDVLRAALRGLRKALDVTGIWRRNSCTRPRNAKKRQPTQNL
jgi:hypothetical protein